MNKRSYFKSIQVRSYLLNSVLYKRAGAKGWDGDICCRYIKDKDMIGGMVTHGKFRNPDNTVLADAGWTPETFADYIEMLRSLHPEYPAMLTETTFENPVLALVSESAVARFSLFCYLRATWETPKAAHMLLHFWYKKVKWHPIEYALLAGLYHQEYGNSGHWFCHMPVSQPLPCGTRDTALRRYSTCKQTTVGNVDSHLQLCSYEYGAERFFTNRDAAPMAKRFINFCNTYFWGGERHAFVN
jgi:hypothetical protein